ncbi:MAG: hypothetical protein ABW360_17520 [Phenylobacterium sp.]
MTDPAQKEIRGPLGCLFLLMVLIVEMAVGWGVGILAFGVFAALFRALGWTDEVFKVVAVTLAILVGGLPAWGIDIWVKRRFGQSALDQVPWIP